MASKGAKLARKRAQRGRPRDEAASRTESGQISRAKDPADKLATEVRARKLGISLAASRDQRAATFVGSLAMRWSEKQPEQGLSPEQYAAIVEYQKVRADALKAMKAPNSHAAGEGGASSPIITKAYVAWCSRALERYDAAREAIKEAQNNNRADNLLAALQYCVHEDGHHKHMMGWLRILANALAAHFAKGA